MWICQPPGQPTITFDIVLIGKNILLFSVRPRRQISNLPLRNLCFQLYALLPRLSSIPAGLFSAGQRIPIDKTGKILYYNITHNKGTSDSIGKSWQRGILFPGKGWKMEEYFVYPQGVCRIRKPAYAGNGCAIFPIFHPAAWGQKTRCPAADD